MPLDTAAMNRELPKLRSALTRAENSDDPIKVLDAVEKAVNAFDRFGWPDAWVTWRIALDDAFYVFARGDEYPSDEANLVRYHAVSDRL